MEMAAQVLVWSKLDGLANQHRLIPVLQSAEMVKMSAQKYAMTGISLDLINAKLIALDL